MICAVFRMSRMSLKDGGTKRREEIARIASWWRKAASRARGVKNMPIVGTSMLNFERGFRAFWCSTCYLSVRDLGDINGKRNKRTVVSDKSLDIPQNVCIALVGRCGHGGQALVLSVIVCGSRLRVEDEWYCQEPLKRELE
jgi:hypothetical protein